MVRQKRFSTPRAVPFRPPPLSAGKRSTAAHADGGHQSGGSGTGGTAGGGGAQAVDPDIEALKALSVRDVTPMNSSPSRSQRGGDGPLGSRRDDNSNTNIRAG
jgi:hypothetical protein